MSKHRGSPLSLTILALLHYKPLHPYGIQRLIRQWGKDLVVNVGQRTSLYRAIERLTADGLVAVRDTERDHAYPERTVYEVTDEGRRAALEWLEEMLAVPNKEFPEFAAALSNVLLLSPEQVAPILQRRLAAVAETVSGLEAALAEQNDARLHRAGLLELEFLYAVTKAEYTWLQGLVDDFQSGALTWSTDDFSEDDGAQP